MVSPGGFYTLFCLWIGLTMRQKKVVSTTQTQKQPYLAREEALEAPHEQREALWKGRHPRKVLLLPLPRKFSDLVISQSLKTA
jgi:hypothetical protein